MISSVSAANLMRIPHGGKKKQESIIRPSVSQGHIRAADAETLDRPRTHDRGSQEDDGAERFAILHHQRRDQHKLVSSQAGKQPPGTYSLSTHYGLRLEREELHLVLQFTYKLLLWIAVIPNKLKKAIKIRCSIIFLKKGFNCVL